MTYNDDMAKKKPDRNMTWKPTSDDRKLMEALMAKLGVTVEAQLVRMGLRALAIKEGVGA
jgi:hypothetical protein